MKRYGLIHAVGEGILLGDPTRRHLLLMSESLQHREGNDTLHRFRWDDLQGVAVNVPTTRFRFPGFLAGVVSAAVILIAQGDPNLGPEAGAVEVRVDSASHVLPVDRHYLGSYWAPAVRGVQLMLNRLVSDPSSRVLLDHPDRLLRAVALAARKAPGED